MKNLLYLFLALVIFQVTVSAQLQQARTRNVSTTSILVGFEGTAEGLVYISETDADVHSYISPSMGQMLTVNEFILANQIPEETAVEQVDSTQWLTARVNYDVRWISMRDSLTSRFTELTVFKVGTIRVQYFIVGIYKNRFVGIRTFAIET